MILLIDNYDSFTYNLYQYIGTFNDDIKVVRNDKITIEEIEKMKCDDKIDMYVLTNEKRINGAGTIFYDGLLKKFADKIEKDLIIIPSSIHEVILIPSDNGITDEEVNEMIDEVNENELETVEILSNHMYLYRRKEDRIYM